MAVCKGCGQSFGCGCQLTNGLCASCYMKLSEKNNTSSTSIQKSYGELTKEKRVDKINETINSIINKNKVN